MKKPVKTSKKSVKVEIEKTEQEEIKTPELKKVEEKVVEAASAQVEIEKPVLNIRPGCITAVKSVAGLKEALKAKAKNNK